MKRESMLPLAGLLLLLAGPSAGVDVVQLESVHGTGGGRAENSEHAVLSTVGQSAIGMGWSGLDKVETGFSYEYTQLVDSDWADENIGNSVLTVTTQGSIGFMDMSQSEGSGFVYPVDGDNRLYVGSLWISQDETYTANRDYEDDPEQEWTVATDGHIWFAEDGVSDQDIHAAFTDSAAASPRSLSVRQSSEAWASSPQTIDFVLLQYEITNVSADSLKDLYVGVFLDLDINDYVQNTGGTSTEHSLVYVTDPSAVHVGVRLLEDDVAYPPLANLTLIHNPTYVWPQVYVLDEDKYGFQAATAEEYIVRDAPNPDDYSVLASAGPISLAPGAEKHVGFAVVGGESLDDLLTHATVAQVVHQSGVADTPEASTGPPLAVRLMPSAPNPFARETLVRFVIAKESDVNVSVYDIGGRLVRTLAKGRHQPMHYAMTWDGRNEDGRMVSAGVYFVRLAAGQTSQTGRLVCVH